MRIVPFWLLVVDAPERPVVPPRVVVPVRVVPARPRLVVPVFDRAVAAARRVVVSVLVGPR